MEEGNCFISDKVMPQSVSGQGQADEQSEVCGRGGLCSEEEMTFIKEKAIFEENAFFAEKVFRGQSFSEVVEAVKRSIEFDCFAESEKGQALELCYIIAEVMKLPPALAVRIGGDDIPASLAAEVFHALTHEHVALVMENYRKAAYRICRKKMYLRTALYNSVFELESSFANFAGMVLQD